MGKIDNRILDKYLMGECNDQESQEVKNWLELSAENRKEFAYFKKVWQASFDTNKNIQSVDLEEELQKYLIRLDELEFNKPDPISIPATQKRFLTVFLRIAAILIISIGSTATLTYYIVSHKYHNYYYSGSISHQVNAPKGSKSMVVLPDGTKVWLNAGTTLRYANNYGIENRDVELTGEAYFKVVTNPRKPFTVITSELKIKAYGTAFNVKAYPDEKVISTTLEEGKVTITGEGIYIELKPKQNITYEKREFRKNEPQDRVTDKPEKDGSAEIKLAQPRVNKLTNINTQLYTAWKDDRLILESETFSEIAVLLERKFNVSVRVESDELLNYKFRGTFTNETLEQILNALRLAAPIDFSVEKGIVTIKLDENRKGNYMEIINQ